MTHIDLDIVLRACAGDADALTSVLARIRPRVLAYCVRHGSRRNDPEGVAQEVLLAVARLLPGAKFEYIQNFLALVYTIARNKTVQAYRDQPNDILSIDGAAPDRASHVTPLDIVTGRETLAELAGPFRRLSDLERSVLWLRAQGLSYNDIALQLGRTPNALRVHRCRALKTLARFREAV